MSSSHDATVSRIVARFLKSRREGDRVSIDEVLDAEQGVQDARAVRASAIETIARHSRSGGASACPGFEPGGERAGPEADIDDLPEMPTLEGYDIIDCVGRGGMGTVYEAYQRSTGRRIAIKFMLEGAATTESSRRRFEREVELVARLQHRHIVSVIDSGVHKGRYHCVMEYVDGKPLDDVLTPGECDVRAALRMLITICEAVDYAHQRGVLHRDLKPSNILVDAAGEPHLLDFGLAKAIRTDESAGRDMSLSQPGQLLGTLAFMSPEQARGRIEELSVRTDVYSLGAIAYELITGALPCSVDGALGDALLRIELQDPARPASLRAKLDADVDAILLKALEKSPANRFATAGEFAADIRRYLADEPILARRIGAPARAARWIRRNRRIATIGAGAVAIIVAVTAVAFIRITDERDATREVAASFYDSIRGIQPDKPGSNRVETIGEIMDSAAMNIGKLRKQPEFQARLRTTIGLVYRGLSDYEKAEAQFRAALESRRRIYGENHPEVAEAHHNLASALYWLGDHEQAERHYRDALQIRRRLFRRGDLGEGRELARTLDHLASTLSEQDKPAEAVEISREALEIREELLGAGHVDVAQSLNNLARILNKHGRFEEATPLCERAHALLESGPGDEQRRGVASVLHNLAWSRYGVGDLAGAEVLLDQALAMMRDLWGDDHDRVASSLQLLADIKLAAGDRIEAERCAHQALAILRRSFPEGHRDTAATLHMLGLVRLGYGDVDSAEKRLREALAMMQSVWPASHRRVSEAESSLGACLDEAGQDEEAERLLLKSWTSLRERRGAADPAARIAGERIVAFYERRGDVDNAAAHRALLTP